MADKRTQPQPNAKPRSASRGRACRRAGYFFQSIFAVATIFGVMLNQQLAHRFEDRNHDSQVRSMLPVEHASLETGTLAAVNRVEDGSQARQEGPRQQWAEMARHPRVAQIIPGAFLALLVLGLAAYAYRFFRQMKQKDSELACRVAALEESLREAKLQADRATATRTRFFAAASHDLRQPLHAISLYLPLLLKRAEKSKDREMLEAIEKSCAAMRSLLDSLLDISRLDAGMIEPRIGPVSLLETFDRLGVEFAPQAAAKGLQLRVVPADCWVGSDPVLLQRILRVLLANAIRFTRRGRILMGARRNGQSVRVEVWDTGIGLDSETLKHVFDDFYRAENPEEDGHPGIGLGLAITKRIVGLLKDHRLHVRSCPGRGSVFDLALPVVPEPSPHHMTGGPAGRTAPDLQGRRALLIDDDSLVLESTFAMLQAWGFDVIAASSVSDAMVRITEAGALPDVIIADLRLRGSETGLDAILALNEALQRPVPAVIVTGNTDPETIREVTASGLTILRKPVEPAQLQKALTQAMAGEETTRGEKMPRRLAAGGNAVTERR